MTKTTTIPATIKHIVICAGEASGDLLGAQLIKALLKQNSNLKISGVCGKQMQAAGATQIVDADKLAVVGFIEIIKNLKPIRKAFTTIKKVIKSNPPDLFILIDYPGFNLRVAKLAKQAGIKVMYYVSPQIWAWRYHRIKQIKRYVDHMAVLFQFEKPIYQKENIPVSFVGHPLARAAAVTLPREQIAQELRLDLSKPIITICPGSRLQEIKRLMPLLLESISLISQRITTAQFVLPLANSITLTDIQPYLNAQIILAENSQLAKLLSISQAAIAASGTVTLEIALAKVPFVIFYKMSPITAFLAKRVVKTRYFGLCNIIAGKLIAKEFFQEQATANNIANEVVQLMHDIEYRNHMLANLNALPQQLGTIDAANKAAHVALQLLE